LPWAGGVLAIGATIAVACGSSSGDDGGVGSGGRSRSSTIALDASGSALWVTSPDDDQVVEVDPATLEVRRRLPVEGRPQELVVDGEVLLVTGAQRTSLAVVATGSGGDGGGGGGGGAAASAAIDLPCGGSRSVVTVGGEGTDGRHLALVTCPTDDLVAVVDLDEGATVAQLPLAGRPTGIVRAGDELTVTTRADGLLHRFAVGELLAALDAAPAPEADAALPILELEGVVDEAWADGERSASLLGAVDAGPRGPVGAYQVVDHVRKLSSAQIEGDPTYGTPLNGRARLEAALAGDCGARFTDVAEPAEMLSGPVAVAADPGSDLVWVVGQFSRSVSVVRCDGSGPAARSTTVASFEVGDGPRGIVLAEDGRTAYVDVGFDHAVARLALPSGIDGSTEEAAAERTAPELVERRSADGYLSPLAEVGRSMFHDGTDEHLTPFGVVTCASCHPDAGEDGLEWRIETADIERKLRRTPPVWQLDDAEKLLHWNGEFDSTDDLVLTTIQELLGGDGLLIDTAAIEAYLREAEAPPPAPAWTVADRELVARGEAIFEAGDPSCASCHVGDLGSDGALHDVLPRSEEVAAQLDAVVTPPLRGVRGRAPYGHDGRAESLLDLLAEHGDGEGGSFDLDDDERAALLAYLRSR
jgi:DNA-binding beta-propeller fold protein YncE/mono/diheme cytochrome c family protein